MLTVDGREVCRFESSVEVSEELELEGLRFRLLRASLRWSPTMAILLLQGASLPQFMGRRYVVVGGTHRAPHNPCPGMDHAVIAEILGNENGLGPAEICIKISVVYGTMRPQ